MGKDREGKFHPHKGRPAGKGTAKGFDSHSAAGEIEKQFKLEDQLDVNESGTPDSLRHPNRKVDKPQSRTSPISGRVKSARTTNNIDADWTSRAVDNKNTLPEEIIYRMTRAEFAELDHTSGKTFFSFYLPTHQAGVAVNEQQDKIAFKTAVQRIANELGRENASARDMLLSNTGMLVANDGFWRTQGRGLAVLLTENFLRVFKLPYSPENHSQVNKRFYLRPLLPLISNEEYFYILSLSKKQAKVYRADRFVISPIPIPEMPEGIEDVVHFEQKDGAGLFRTGSSGAGGGANYHGIGESGPDHKENFAMYAKEVDRTLHHFLLKKESAPLVLAGVEYLLNIFRKVSTYSHIWDKQIDGSVEYSDLTALHQETVSLMGSLFDARLRKAIDAFGVKSDTSKVSSQPAEIVPAAYYSKVSHLFVQEGYELWGRFDDQNNSITMHNTREQEDESLVDRAVVKTIVNGGDVHILPQEKMPDATGLAAVMRF